MDFKEIYNTYWQRIFRLCMGYINDYDAAKDLTQETFIKVWQNLAKFRNESSIGTWIFRIASNTCLRQIENNNKMPKVNLSFDVEDKLQPSFDGELEFLYQCISELIEIDRIIISLELEDVKQSEIAKIVGISSGNVRVKIHRIKEKLTQKFMHYEP
jgi:RNA polymerase sigma-70 factor (ECF subfamily)